MRWHPLLMESTPPVRTEADLFKVERPEELHEKIPMFARRKLVKEYAKLQAQLEKPPPAS
eukprot:gene28816-47512_t